MVHALGVSVDNAAKCTGPAGLRLPSVGVTWIWLIYAAGVAIGLWRTDGPPAVRLTLALLWPIGPAVFVVVVTGLVLAAMIAFPWFGALAAAGLLAWWLL